MKKRISIYIDGANFVYGIKTINKRYNDFIENPLGDHIFYFCSHLKR